MLTIQLNGGLGNQLFQYALGRELGRGGDVYYDTSHLAKASMKRDCELQLFHTQGYFGEYPQQSSQLLLSERKWYHSVTDKLHVPSDWYGYHHEVKDIREGYLKGFRQSYKYFDHIRDELLHDIVPLEPLDEVSQDVRERMGRHNSVSLHIRRGDFQKARFSTIHLKGKHWHAVLPVSYYEHAILLMKKKLRDPVFYVFSNDISWCRSQFIGDDYVFVDHNAGKDSYRDMLLMSHAKHNIIANSTFSWWGAYLNQNPEKVVISPKKRYDVNIGIMDLILPDWIVV